MSNSSRPVPDRTGPLQGIRVLDLSRVLAAPWATQMLADFGAQVIKIERPRTGDDTREWGPPWFRDENGHDTALSTYYLCANRGKHSVTVDISTDKGRRLIRDLAQSCDVFVENFKTGGLQAKGLGYQDLARVRPDIIYCSVTGFGQTGPMANDAGYDYLIQAMGGIMSVTGKKDGDPGAGPLRVGVAVSDLTCGMYAAIAILAALHHRDLTGEGQYIDLALLDTQVGWLANQATAYLGTGVTPQRTGERHPSIVPYQPFQTSDGYLLVAVGNDRQFRSLCEAAGCAELGADARYASSAMRLHHQDDLIARLSAVFQQRTTAEWTALLHAAGVPCGPINSVADALEQEQIRQRDMVIEMNHPDVGPMKLVGNPIRFSATPVNYSRPPPLLGADTREVLRTVLNKSEEEIDALRREGII